MQEQYIPNYKHDFENSTQWIMRETKHYVFRYFSGSIAEKEIEHIIETQESGYQKIIDFLSVSVPEKKIEYYLYPDEITKKNLMGDSWYAQAVFADFIVHVLYTEKIKPLGPHEDTHLLSLPWGLSICFFQEGLAEYMVGHAWDGRSHADYVMEGYIRNLYPPLADFFRHETWLETDDTHALFFYSLAGLLTTFLITKFGKEPFEAFYRQIKRANTSVENISIFENIFSVDVKQIEEEIKKVILQ